MYIYEYIYEYICHICIHMNTYMNIYDADPYIHICIYMNTHMNIGIGISFGLTRFGEIFITGLSPRGAAKASGKIKEVEILKSPHATKSTM